MKNWNKENPKNTGDYICRMQDGYIKMCHWNGILWLDMWKTTIDGIVLEWMDIPYDVEIEEDIKCVTFNKQAQESIPTDIRKKMDADRENAERELY